MAYKRTLRGSVRSWSCFRNTGITQARPNIADVLWHDAGTEVDQKPRGRGWGGGGSLGDQHVICPPNESHKRRIHERESICHVIEVCKMGAK